MELFTGERIDRNIVKRFSDIVAEEDPTNRIKLEEMSAVTVHALRELMLEMTNPSGLSQSKLLPKIISIKAILIDIYGEEIEAIKHIKKCIRIMEETRPNAGEIYDGLIKILPKCLMGDELSMHRGMKCNQDRRFIKWGDGKLRLTATNEYTEMNLFDDISKEIYEKFQPSSAETKPTRHRGENNSGKNQKSIKPHE